MNTFAPVVAALSDDAQSSADGWYVVEGDAFEKLDLIADGSCKLIITSPPYNIGKEYERDQRLSLRDYVRWLDKIIGKLCDKVAADGHVCWQSGNFVLDGEVFPLDTFFYRMFKRRGFKLRNRIIWHFNFGLHAQTRFSGRYETLLWFTKTDDYIFNLDPVRVPQLYPGKRHSSKKGQKAGQPSGNPQGKNPSDFWVFDAASALRNEAIWDFPNVKAMHPEKTIHPCQFPSELVERCVLALTNPSPYNCQTGATRSGSLTDSTECFPTMRTSRRTQRLTYIDRAKICLRPVSCTLLATRLQPPTCSMWADS